MSPRHLRESANMSLNMSNVFSQFNDVYNETKHSTSNNFGISNGRKTTTILLNQDCSYKTAALPGEPIPGIGIQVKKNREKMKEIFRKGRSKASNERERSKGQNRYLRRGYSLVQSYKD